MEFTDKPKQAKVHVPNFKQFASLEEDYDEVNKVYSEYANDYRHSDYIPPTDTPRSSSEPTSLESNRVVTIPTQEATQEHYNTKSGIDQAFDDRSTEGFDEFENLDYKTAVDKCSERVSIGGEVNVPAGGVNQRVARVITREGLAKACDSGDLNISFTGSIEEDEYLNQQSTQSHYETKSGIDFITRFIDVHSTERVRGALLFNIGKYCERYGAKDDTLKEANKIVDYANRLLQFEESLFNKGEV